MLDEMSGLAGHGYNPAADALDKSLVSVKTEIPARYGETSLIEDL
jgi:hypothetical protein